MAKENKVSEYSQQKTHVWAMQLMTARVSVSAALTMEAGIIFSRSDSVLWSSGVPPVTKEL